MMEGGIDVEMEGLNMEEEGCRIEREVLKEEKDVMDEIMEGFVEMEVIEEGVDTEAMVIFAVTCMRENQIPSPRKVLKI